jgi:hypothetical protein
LIEADAGIEAEAFEQALDDAMGVILELWAPGDSRFALSFFIWAACTDRVGPDFGRRGCVLAQWLIRDLVFGPCPR